MNPTHPGQSHAQNLFHHLEQIWIQNKRAEFYIDLIAKQEDPKAMEMLRVFHWPTIQFAQKIIDQELRAIMAISPAISPSAKVAA